jgi:hypothetical protein
VGQLVSGAAGYHSHLSIARIFLGDFFVTKPLTVKEKQQRKRIRSRAKNAAKPAPTPHTLRYVSERKVHGIRALARVTDNKLKRAPVYLLDKVAATSLAHDLNSLEEFKAVMGSVVTMRDIVANMLAIEAVQDMPELTAACDRNRELLYRLEVGPFRRTSHSPKVRDEEDTATPENPATSKDPDWERESPEDTYCGEVL